MTVRCNYKNFIGVSSFKIKENQKNKDLRMTFVHMTQNKREVQGVFLLNPTNLHFQAKLAVIGQFVYYITLGSYHRGTGPDW